MPAQRALFPDLDAVDLAAVDDRVRDLAGRDYQAAAANLAAFITINNKAEGSAPPPSSNSPRRSWPRGSKATIDPHDHHLAACDNLLYSCVLS